MDSNKLDQWAKRGKKYRAKFMQGLIALYGKEANHGTVLGKQDISAKGSGAQGGSGTDRGRYVVREK